MWRRLSTMQQQLDGSGAPLEDETQEEPPCNNVDAPLEDVPIIELHIEEPEAPESDDEADPNAAAVEAAVAQAGLPGQG